MKKFLVIILLYINDASSNYCYWNTGCPYKYYSTETAYNSVRGDIRDSVIKLTGCEPVSIWGMYRHGQQKPNTVFSDKMKAAIPIKNLIVESYKKGHSSLCAQDVENLQNWEYNSKFFDEKQDITEEGRKEMLGLGKRLKEAFPDLLKDLRKGNYRFRSAKGVCSEQSIDSFVSSFGKQKLAIEAAKTGMDVMSPYANCGFYQNNVQNNPTVYAESEKYLGSSEFLATRDRIQRRSGIEYSLSAENVTALYDLCRFTWSTFDSKLSPWCALFTKDDLEVLEYAQDLRHYYRSSYGTDVNELFGKVPLGDLFTSFDNVTKGGGKKIIAYVTRAAVLGQMYTTLGLFKDNKPLTGAHRDRDRKFRTSKMAVFSANLVAVLNRCVKEGSEDYNVVIYLNEEPIRSLCEEGVCSWEDFETKLRPFVNATIDFCGFLFRYADDSFTSAFVSTVGIDFKVKTVFRHDKRVKLQIWDTAGQERYRTITTAYYRGAMGFILMYDITNEESFNSVQDWVTQIKTYSWDNAQVILVGNKCDMEEERVVSAERGRQLADQLGVEFYETSAKENINVKTVFERLVDIICDKMSESLDSEPAMLAGGARGQRLTEQPQGNSNPICNC